MKDLAAGHLGIGEVGTVEVDTAQGGVAEIGFVEVGSLQVGGADVGSDQLGPAKIGAGEIGETEVSILQIRIAEIGFAQVGDAQIRAAEVGSDEISAPQQGAAEIGPAQDCAAEVGSTKVGLAQIGASEVSLAQFGATQVGVGKAGLAEGSISQPAPDSQAPDGLLGDLVDGAPQLEDQFALFLLGVAPAKERVDDEDGDGDARELDNDEGGVRLSKRRERVTDGEMALLHEVAKSSDQQGGENEQKGNPLELRYADGTRSGAFFAVCHDPLQTAVTLDKPVVGSSIHESEQRAPSTKGTVQAEGRRWG